MLSLPAESRYGPIQMTPQRFKDETLRALVDLTEAAARHQPSVMLFEDAHWADPTSLEILDLLIDRVQGFPLLILITHRPEFQNRWASHGHVSAMNLSKLTKAQSAAMVTRVAKGKTLPGNLQEQILIKTDGVPLYVEELTKAILESKEIEEKEDRYEFRGDPNQLTIPATLRDSLMARLDRNQAVKQIAQMGAVIGREFSYELIQAIAPKTKSELDQALQQLTESGLAFRRGTPPEATYTFKFHEAMPSLRAGIDAADLGGGKIELPYTNTVLAEAMALAGNLDDSLNLVDEQIAQVLRPGWDERVFYAEILRLKGIILLMKNDPANAERQFLASLDCARQQQAKSWELRTATGLARLWQSQGKRREARDLLVPVYDWFTEGFDTRDLKEAKALLEELSP